MYDTFTTLLGTHPDAHRIAVVYGEIESTLALVESAIKMSV